MAGSSAAERPYQPAAGGGARQKVPGTPQMQRRDTTGALSHARERAVQDPGLKDYVCCTSPYILADLHFGTRWRSGLAEGRLVR